MTSFMPSDKTAPWTIESVLRWASDDFLAKGIDSPRLDAELLLAHALNTTRMQLILDAKKPLLPGELGRFRALVKRRRAREPVAYLRGEREFFGRSFAVDARVLVPRPDTECLVTVALTRTRHCSMSMRALDACTGSGCVAITLAKERLTSHADATDVSPDALAVAQHNALRLGAYNVAFYEADLFPPHGHAYDIVVSNPPYIASSEIDTLMPEVSRFEPRIALDGGPDGLSFVRRLLEGGRSVLSQEGVLAIEVGDGQAPQVAALFEQNGYRDVECARDYGGIERVVSGVWYTPTK